jgi:hypothetical protein
MCLWIKNVGAMHELYQNSSLPRPPAADGARHTVSRVSLVSVLIQFIENCQQRYIFQVLYSQFVRWRFISWMCALSCALLLTVYYDALFTFSQHTLYPASRPSTGRCVFLHRAMLQMSRCLYRTHCRDTPRALALVSMSGSLMTCVRQRMTDYICQSLPSLLGKEREMPFIYNVVLFYDLASKRTAQGAAWIKEINTERNNLSFKHKSMADVLGVEAFSASGKKYGFPVRKLGKPGNWNEMSQTQQFCQMALLAVVVRRAVRSHAVKWRYEIVSCFRLFCDVNIKRKRPNASYILLV